MVYLTQHYVLGVLQARGLSLECDSCKANLTFYNFLETYMIDSTIYKPEF